MHSASLYRGISFIRGMSLVSCSGLWPVCPHLCWDKSSCVSGFSQLECLNEINRRSCGQIYPKLELSLLGIPTNRAHPKQASTYSNNRLNNAILRNMEHKSMQVRRGMHSASLYRGIPFIRGLSRSVSPRGINKQQLEIV